MLYLEKQINNTFIAGFNELKKIVSEADVLEADAAPRSSPSSAVNSSDDVTDTGVAQVVVASDDAHSWSDFALEAVGKLSDDVEWIKWKANRVSFAILHDYAEQYGFYR